MISLAAIELDIDGQVVETGDIPALLLLISFGATFGITRFITHSIRADRFSWLGDVEAGDVHIHHLVWGIILLLISGLLAIAVQPPLGVTAIIFGIGAALTLDEFALWLHLDDVYWSEQGRQSIDAVIVFSIVAGFLALGVYPIDLSEISSNVGSIIGFVLSLAFLWSFVIVCFMKGKLIMGVVGIYLFPVALWGTCRLAKPDSSWAKKRYDEAKMARARERHKGEEKIAKPETLTS